MGALLIFFAGKWLEDKKGADFTRYFLQAMELMTARGIIRVPP
jgi:hypothetical protein